MTLEIHAIRSTRRALEIFDRLGYPRKKVRLAVNRWSKNIELDQKQVEDFLGERVSDSFRAITRQPSIRSISVSHL
jgi:hypothetical protein